MTSSSWQQRAIDQIISICGIDSAFNARTRKHLEMLQPIPLAEILAKAKETLNLARRHVISNEIIDADRLRESESLASQGGLEYLQLLKLTETPTHKLSSSEFSSHVEEMCGALRDFAERATEDDLVAFHRNYLLFYRRVENLWLPHQGPDAREEYWRVLAVTQRTVSQSGVPNLNLLWRRILLSAGIDYPLHYSEVALLGFCSSERSSTTETFAPVISTFIGWAHSRGLGENRFKALSRYFVVHLEEIYPRKDHHPWSGFDIAISGTRSSVTIYGDWLREVLTEKGISARPTSTAVTRRVPTKREFDAIISSLGALPEDVAIARIEQHYQFCSEYTWRHGDVEFLGVSLTRMAMALLENPTFASNDRASILISEMAIELIRWQPHHRSGWHLWVRALLKSGEYQGAETILWESIRRFPHSRSLRNQLADILVDQGRHCEAEHLLRLAIEDFPADGASYHQLAKLLAALPDRLDEAILIGNKASKLLGLRSKNLTKALRKIALPASTYNPSSMSLLDRELNLPWADSTGAIGQSIVLHARAMRAQFQLTCPGLDAEESSARVLASLVSKHDLPFARFSLARTLPNYQNPDDSSSAFLIAFVRAIITVDTKDWETLLKSAGTLQSKWLARVAESLLGSEAKDTSVADWLNGRTRVAGNASALLRRRLVALAKNVDTEEDVVIWLSKRRKQVVRILGDAAASMFDEEVAA